MSGPQSSRRFCIQVIIAYLLTACYAAAYADPPRLLKSSRTPGEISRIELLLEVGGDLKVAEQDKVKPLKMSVEGKIAYHERTLSNSPDTASVRSVRRYDIAEAIIKIDRGGLKPQLRGERQLVGVLVADATTTLYSPTGLLTSEELELIDVPANSLLVDQLLPERAVAPGDKWQHADTLLAPLFNLDAISKSDLSSELKEIDGTAARIELSGTIQGAVGGVSTDLDVKGRYKFDLATGRITWVALLVKEVRSIGHVGPGADLVARLQMTIKPGATDTQLSDTALAGLPLEPNNDLTNLEYVAPGGAFRFVHDRRWHAISDTTDMVAMRLIERGDLIAQCNVSALAKAETGKPTTLARFQEDIQRSLDKSFERFLEASEGNTTSGYHIIRVVADGKVSELPIQWIYYLVSDEQGQQVVFAFTLETKALPQLGEIDQNIVHSLEMRGDRVARK